MTLAKSTYCREQADVYWQQALQELEKGDLRQASEKGWGAASQMVKAVAEFKELRHDGHALLWAVVDTFRDPELRADFGLANALHINFYEGWLSESLVSQYLAEVGSFMRVLDETELHQ